MRRIKRGLWATVISVFMAASAHAEAANLEDFTRDPVLTDALLSPDGKHLALRVIVDGRALLQISNISDLKVVGTLAINGDNDVADFYWANNERLLVGVERRLGSLGKAEATGSLLSVNIDGKRLTHLVEHDWSNVVDLSGDYRDFMVVDPLPDDHDHALVQQYDGGTWGLYRYNIYNGTRNRLMLAHVSSDYFARFWTDAKGEVRGEDGTEEDNKNVFLYRDPGTEEWKIFDSFYSASGGMEPQFFDVSGKFAIVFDDREEPVQGVYRVDLQSGKRELLYRDATYDAGSLIMGTNRQPIGVEWEAERQRWAFFDGEDSDVALFVALRKTFGNVSVHFVNFDADRTQVLVRTESDIEPPVYYVVDLKKHSIVTRIPTRPWIDSSQMAHKRAIEFKARDGLTIHGYLTLPGRLAAGGAPLIVMPHGGPYGVRDNWDFSPEVQLLASRGYAILQINFRGSEGYGRAFEKAGYGEWGGAMQDDIVDGVKWATQRPDINGARVCIYGASYGAYAALEGAARDGDMFRCAAGYAGVYDLPMMWRKGDIGFNVRGRAYLKTALGADPAAYAARSPARSAPTIKIPVFLAHGRDDHRAPVQQFEAMRDALKEAGRPAETLLKDKEGHGFYSEKNRLELYTKLLAFFDRNLATPAKD